MNTESSISYSDLCEARYYSSCYFIVPEPLNHHSAVSMCQAAGGHLATIGNQAENDVTQRMALSKFCKKILKNENKGALLLDSSFTMLSSTTLYSFSIAFYRAKIT